MDEKLIAEKSTVLRRAKRKTFAVDGPSYKWRIKDDGRASKKIIAPELGHNFSDMFVFDAYRNPPILDEVTLPDVLFMAKERRLFLKQKLASLTANKIMTFADDDIQVDRLSFFLSAIMFGTNPVWLSHEQIVLYHRIIYLQKTKFLVPELFGATEILCTQKAEDPECRIMCHACPITHSMSTHFSAPENSTFLYRSGSNVWTIHGLALSLSMDLSKFAHNRKDERFTAVF